LLRAIDAYEGYFVTKCALRLAPLVFVRPGELRGAQWPEIDLEKAEWRIPAIRMKMREQHIVPLSRQAVEIFVELEPTTNRVFPSRPGAPRYVFPSARTHERPMSENAILAALRRMGYTKDEMTGHGFRSMASTLLHEQGWNHHSTRTKRSLMALRPGSAQAGQKPESNGAPSLSRGCHRAPTRPRRAQRRKRGVQFR